MNIAADSVATAAKHGRVNPGRTTMANAAAGFAVVR